MAILISGASGYIGYNLAARLVERDEPVVAIVRPTTDISNLSALSSRLQIYVDDGTTDGLVSVFEKSKISTVFHLAACRPDLPDKEDAKLTLESNIQFGVRLLDAAIHTNCKNFVDTGSWWQFDQQGTAAPNSLYAATKHAFQEILSYYVKTHGIKAVTLILYNIYGPNFWQGRLITALYRASLGEPVDTTPGGQVLDYVHVSDIVDAYLVTQDLLDKGEIGQDWERFFLSSEQRKTVKEIAQVFEEVCDRPLAINWGAHAYRPNQVFLPCPANPGLPSWNAKTMLKDGLKEFVEDSRLWESA